MEEHGHWPECWWWPELVVGGEGGGRRARPSFLSTGRLSRLLAALIIRIHRVRSIYVSLLKKSQISANWWYGNGTEDDATHLVRLLIRFGCKVLYSTGHNSSTNIHAISLHEDRHYPVITSHSSIGRMDLLRLGLHTFGICSCGVDRALKNLATQKALTRHRP